MQQLFENLWVDYLKLTQDAERIHQLFSNLGENIINDHIALRTFNRGKANLDQIAKFLESYSYFPVEEYHFEAKKLRAYHFENKFNEKSPKIFVSELLLEQMPDNVQDICNRLINEGDKFIDENGLSLPMMPWNTITKEEYLELRSESEYAAWLATFGLRANHFTVSVNELKGFSTLESVNQFLKDNDFALNTSGGEVKGSKEVCLKQSSTMANIVNWSFSNGEMEVRSCFYEFAERFKLPNIDSLYHGFVAASADKIFESTNAA
ncbi:DUF1338 domain-containing protein [Pleionea sediminis]|uniref:DUF1338 domain-containing protein n=1 Tax=Pleionea sediminis TaxID=2569479 RepID=UPI0011849DF0|nr:DUF1338 domain-containing protein [Pleionea sediminis]